MKAHLESSFYKSQSVEREIINIKKKKFSDSMFRTQLYNPRIDPERQEYYNGTDSNDSDGYFVSVDRGECFSPGSKLWYIYKSKHWHTIKSITCRSLMIAYTIYLTIETYKFFDEILILFNLIYLILIFIDCWIVVKVRHGLEDRWCSMSILFFICANTSSLFMLELFYNSFLTHAIFQPDMARHVDLEYRLENVLINASINSTIYKSDQMWQDTLDIEVYYNELSKHEAIFCVVLIVCRLFLPQAMLTWSAVSTMCEFSFNTIFDVYSTLNLCRDAKLNLPENIVIACFIISNGALITISLNLFYDDSKELSNVGLPISILRSISDNFYFRIVIQIIFADLPFFVIHLLIITGFQTLIRPDIYYLITKQCIIITCKVFFMLNNWCHSYNDDKGEQSD